MCALLCHSLNGVSVRIISRTCVCVYAMGNAYGILDTRTNNVQMQMHHIRPTNQIFGACVCQTELRVSMLTQTLTDCRKIIRWFLVHQTWCGEARGDEDWTSQAVSKSVKQRYFDWLCVSAVCCRAMFIAYELHIICIANETRNFAAADNPTRPCVCVVHLRILFLPAKIRTKKKIVFWQQFSRNVCFGCSRAYGSVYSISLSHAVLLSFVCHAMPMPMNVNGAVCVPVCVRLNILM